MAHNPYAQNLTEAPPPRDDAKASFTMQGNGTATSVANSATYYKMAGNTVPGVAVGFDLSVTNRAEYTGSDTRKFKASVAVTISTPVLLGSQLLAIALLKNGTVIAASDVRTTAQALSQPTSLGLEFFVELATNDYIEVAVRNTSGTDDLTVGNCLFTIFAT